VIAYYRGLLGDNLSQANAGTFGSAAAVEMVSARRESGLLQKMKNSGNEAKKYLKTNDITFSDGANYARFECESAAIRA
jgi:hypothetical protein